MRASDVRDLRRRIGLSQQGLAALLGVAVTTVHRWETGKSPIPPYLELALKSAEVKRDGHSDGRNGDAHPGQVLGLRGSAAEVAARD